MVAEDAHHSPDTVDRLLGPFGVSRWRGRGGLEVPEVHSAWLGLFGNHLFGAFGEHVGVFPLVTDAAVWSIYESFVAIMNQSFIFLLCYMQKAGFGLTAR